jgi:Spy/CpxP family protein refolding chaperone
MTRSRLVVGLAPVVLAAAFGCGGGTPQASTAASAASENAPTDAGPVPASDAGPDAAAAPENLEVGDTGGPAVEDEEDESTADLREHHRHHHHGGFAMFIAMSLDSLGTTPDQAAAITKIRTDLFAKLEPARDAEKALLLTLADGVAAGKVDKKKVEAATTKVTAAAGGVHEAVADSLNELHGVLTPPQRTALVEKLEAHFEVWNAANPADESAERDAHGGHLGRLAKELGLTADQVAKVRASFKASMGKAGVHSEHKEAEEHLKAFGKAFESDKFDSKKIATGVIANAHIATWGVTRTSRFYEAVAPVLTPDQRSKLADSLRHHANYTPTPTEP